MSSNQQTQPNPIVFFDITIGTTVNFIYLKIISFFYNSYSCYFLFCNIKEVGRIKFELFADVVPRTAENFRQFCTGEYKKDGVPIGFKGAPFHRLKIKFQLFLI